jgi:6-phosphogluconate dehydrogenase (decarboxylating)
VRRKAVPCIPGGATIAEEEKVKMKVAMIGLGKMGANMTTRLLGKGHQVVAFDVKEEAVVERLRPILEALAPARKRRSGTSSWPRCATSSAGTR